MALGCLMAASSASCRKTAALPRAGATATAVAPAVVGSASVPVPTMVDEVQLSIANHAAEPIDNAWVASVEPALKGDLAAMQRKYGMTVASVDCRAVTCLAHLIWPSLKQYREHAPDVVGSRIRLSCRESITSKTTEHYKDGRVHSLLLVDCSQERVAATKDYQRDL